ncbi:MAG: hypothetical protein WAT81_00005 [Candidatus Moraniibacteriota bacterium]
MIIRPVLIVPGIVAIFVIAAVAYFWPGDRNPDRRMTENDQSLSASSGGSVQSTNTASQNTDANDGAQESLGENESIETLVSEIERSVAGDTAAIEDELSGENESFMEGAVVMEQLGQSYDEASY